MVTTPQERRRTSGEATDPHPGCDLRSLALVTVVIGVRLWWIPEWQLRSASTPSYLVRLINDYRLAVGPLFVGMLQGLGGAAILYGLWLNVREHAFARVQHRAQRLKDATAQLESAHGSTRVAAVHVIASDRRFGRASCEGMKPRTAGKVPGSIGVLLPIVPCVVLILAPHYALEDCFRTYPRRKSSIYGALPPHTYRQLSAYSPA